MAFVVQLTGPAGTGKTRSAVDLDSKSTYYINADGKPLAWAGWRSSYSKEKKNYLETSDTDTITKVLRGISEQRPDIKVVMIDTITAIENDMEMRDMKKSGYDKWKDFAMDVYELYTIASQLREDLIIIFCAHTESFQENGETFYRTKHGGQKATKLNLNSRLAYNLYTDVTVNSSNEREYWFVTQTDGHTEARSVEGVLPYRMPNDLAIVVKLIQEKDLGIQV